MDSSLLTFVTMSNVHILNIMSVALLDTLHSGLESLLPLVEIEHIAVALECAT